MRRRSDVNPAARTERCGFLLLSYVPLKPALLHSRMKALCWNCWVSKYPPGSLTHTFSAALIPPLACGLRCVCFIHAWPADLQNVSQTGRSTCSCLPNQTREPFAGLQHVLFPFNSPSSSAALLLCTSITPGRFRSVSPSSLLTEVSYHRMDRRVWWSLTVCVWFFSSFTLCIN